MSHDLMNENMVYFAQTPWHKLGTKLEESDRTDSQKVLEASGLDFEVKKIETTITVNDTTIDTGHFCTYREQDGETIILGNVGARYEILQNQDAFIPFDDALLEFGYKYETAGAIRNGRKIWILAKNGSFEVGGDKIDKYMLVSNSHDGSSCVTVRPTPIRVVCNNTLNIALDRESKRKLSIRHTSSVKDNLMEVSLALKTAEGDFDKAVIHMNKMADLRSFDVVDYLENVIPDLRKRGTEKTFTSKGKVKVDRKLETFDQLITNYESGKGNSGENLWHAYNAVTEYVDHQKYEGHKDWVKTTQFGLGNRIKERAFVVASELADKKLFNLSMPTNN